MNIFQLETKKILHYHELENNNPFGIIQIKYALERYANLYNSLKKCNSQNYNITIMYSIDMNDNNDIFGPVIYDGHHRAAILYHLYGPEYIIYPKIMITCEKNGLHGDLGECMSEFDHSQS